MTSIATESQYLAPFSVTVGDSTELIRRVAPASVDFALLDPDYNDWDSLVANGFLEDVYRTLKPGGNVIAFTKQPFDQTLRTAVQPHFRREIIWSFSNGGAWVSNKMPLVSHQKLYWLAPTGSIEFNPRTGMSYGGSTKSMTRSSKVFGGYKEPGKAFVMSDEGTWMRDHYHFNKPTNVRVFTKPRELIDILVRCFSPKGGMVLDPFFGSGVTGMSCIDNDRQFIGIEIDGSAVDEFLLSQQGETGNDKESNNV